MLLTYLLTYYVFSCWLTVGSVTYTILRLVTHNNCMGGLSTRYPIVAIMVDVSNTNLFQLKC